MGNFLKNKKRDLVLHRTSDKDQEWNRWERKSTLEIRKWHLKLLRFILRKGSLENWKLTRYIVIQVRQREIASKIPNEILWMEVRTWAMLNTSWREIAYCNKAQHFLRVLIAHVLNVHGIYKKNYVYSVYSAVEHISVIFYEYFTYILHNDSFYYENRFFLQ